MITPSFFRLANSEHTQDAFIIWFLEWANPKKEYIRLDAALHDAAKKFVHLLLFPNDSYKRINIASVSCKRQENHIDVLALVTDTNGKQYAVIIEDKIDTCAHDNQLIRYTKDVKNRYKGWELHCVYLKTGNESKHSLNKMEAEYNNDEWVKQNKPIFKIVLRQDILMILDKCYSQNRIFMDFYENLNRVQELTETYTRQDKVVGAWGNVAWQGFFMGLEEKIKNGRWNHSVYPVKKNSRGRELFGWQFKMPKLSVVEDDSVWIFLNLCLSNLTLKVSNRSDCRAIDLTDVAELNGQLSQYGMKLEVRKARRDRGVMTLANIIRLDGSSFIGENDFVDIECVADQLNQLQYFLLELAKHIVIK